VATWTPNMIVMFAMQPKIGHNPRKSKRQAHCEERNYQFKWDKAMKRQLDRVELVGVAFNDAFDEMATMTVLFGELSFEADALRFVRDTVGLATPFDPPEAEEEPGLCSSESDSDEEGYEVRLRARAPVVAGAESLEVQKREITREAVEEEDTLPDAGTSLSVVKMTKTDKELAKDMSRGDDARSGPKTQTCDEGEDDIRSSLGHTPEVMDDRPWPGEDSEILSPPTKRRRSQDAPEFCYTQKPDVQEIEEWEGAWSWFVKVQEVLRRGPNVKNPKSMGSIVKMPKKQTTAYRRFLKREARRKADDVGDEDPDTSYDFDD